MLSKALRMFPESWLSELSSNTLICTPYPAFPHSSLLIYGLYLCSHDYLPIKSGEHHLVK